MNLAGLVNPRGVTVGMIGHLKTSLAKFSDKKSFQVVELRFIQRIILTAKKEAIIPPVHVEVIRELSIKTSSLIDRTLFFTPEDIDACLTSFFQIFRAFLSLRFAMPANADSVV